MEQGQLNWIANFIWGIADDVLRDLYVRGKYRDVILPMTVLRRLDAVLEPTKQAVLDMKASLDKARIVHQDQALRQAAGQAFYNTSKFTLRDLRARASQQQLKADFEAYLDGFSPNVQDILENFEFRNQIPRLSKADALGTLIEKLLSPDINLSPNPVLNGDGSVKHPGLDNHGMGTIFEELVRRFNEENNEEAGEHWTPRDAVQAHGEADLPADRRRDRIRHLPALRRRLRHGRHADRGRRDAEAARRAAREAGRHPPLRPGDQRRNLRHLQGGPPAQGRGRCRGQHRGRAGVLDALERCLSVPRVRLHALQSALREELEERPGADGGQGRDQGPPLHHRARGRSRVFAPHPLQRRPDALPGQHAQQDEARHHSSAAASPRSTTARSLFTGDAGQGESNIRRWIIENDWLEAIVALPLNMFYNTGIATYIWVLTNRKPEHRRGKVQLIDATQWFKPLRKNLGKKNCELSEEDIQRICDTFLAFEETEQSKIFPNAAFGYWKVTVERPLRLKGIDPDRAYTPKEIKALKETAERDESAPPVIRKIHKKGTAPDPLHGLFEATINGKPAVVEYEPDSDLRDTEQVPLLEEGGIEAFLRREVLPHAPDAWYDPESVKTGYEISFTRYFYKPQPLRTLEEIRADILALEKETEGLLGEIIGGAR